MNALKNIAAIGSIIAAAGCVENAQVPKRTTPVVTIGGESSSRDVRVPPDTEYQSLQKEDASDPVKIILESNRRYRDAMMVITPIVTQLNRGGWDGDARCNVDPVIMAMQKKNRQLTDKINRLMAAAIGNGQPDPELSKCLEGLEMPKDCGERLNSSELGRILVEDKKATGEYWKALADCYQEEFNGHPAKKP